MKQMLRDCPFQDSITLFTPPTQIFFISIQSPFQDSITLFTPPTQIFFISIQSWRGTRDIKFSSLYNFFLFIWGAPHIKFRQKINAPPLPFPKPYYTFFLCPPPYFFNSPSNLARQIKNSILKAWIL